MSLTEVQERCRRCGKKVLVMCMKNTGFCSQKCQRVWEERRAAEATMTKVFMTLTKDTPITPSSPDLFPDGLRAE